MIANTRAERANRITEHAFAAGALQKPEEFSQLLQWLDWLQPKIIVEIGCDCGGTLAAWTQIAEGVVGITLPDNSQPFSSERPLDSHGARIIYGDSHQPDTVAALTGLLIGYPIDFLFIDGDHTYEGVKADWEAYRHLARWVGFHDLIPDREQPTMGVHRLWAEISTGRADCQEFVSPPYTWGGIGIRPGGAW